uniref:Uncharacterized protein n=1 Tax=Myoviridae sp. ctLnO19 TaxID=2825085 RepID=A0A8S5P038_9CAUD|nr:MAG TPA: hypothetical protein [Myoviridae sp. ctLnO19]DAJ69119.1 MAG TPA: hypothetical protein [Caudoviricetes sp.]
MTTEFKSKEQLSFHLEQVKMCNGLVKYLRGNNGVFVVNDFSIGSNPSSPDDCYIGTFMARNQSILDDVLDGIVTNMSLESVNGSLTKVLNLADGYQTFSVTKTKSENATILRFHVKFCQPADLEFTTCLKLSADITVFYKQ